MLVCLFLGRGALAMLTWWNHNFQVMSCGIDGFQSKDTWICPSHHQLHPTMPHAVHHSCSQSISSLTFFPLVLGDPTSG